MKYTNWIKLLSVLLCALMLCTACAAPAQDPADNGETTPTVPETPMLDEVEAKLNNFFGISEVNSWKTLTTATRLDGSLVAGNEMLIVLRNAKIDHLNKVTETFTVYNTVLQTEVLKVENTYEYGEYAEFNWDNYYYDDIELKFPESVMKVEAKTYYELPYIKVSRAKVTPIDKATYEENEGNSHTVEITYDYYDVAGTEIVTGTKKDSIYYVGGNALNFANVVATFDLETFKMTSKVAADNTVVRYDYTSETEEYGYYLDRTQNSAINNTEKFFEVYNKENGALVLRYYLDGAKGNGRAYMMAGGDVLVQYVREVDKDKNEAHNVEYNGAYKMVESYLVDVPTGIAEKVELGYILDSVYTAEDFADDYNTENKGITLTENAANIAFAYEIVNGKRTDDLDLFVLNNDGSVMFKMDRIVPEHVVGNYYSPLGYVQLPGGDYLVDVAGLETIDGMPATKAIVSAEGKVRSYLTSDAKVVGKYVVYDGGVYDYDMKLKFDISIDEDYRFVGTIGNNILISKYYEEEDTTNYFKLSATEDSLYATQIFDEKRIEYVAKDYVVVQDNETGKYSLYNADLEHVLTTLKEMYVNLCDEKYMVGTELEVDGEIIRIFYAIG